MRGKRRIRKREQERMRSCDGKVAYPTAREAKAQAIYLTFRDGAHMDVYHCRFCSTDEAPRFHVGHARRKGWK